MDNPAEAAHFGALPYVLGDIYNRRADIHARFGGQERGGIATPADCNFVFLFTGEQGEQFGYSDGLRTDGMFEYTGEGQVGDMQFVRGNRAVRYHSDEGKELLLFEAQKQKGQYRFKGSFDYQGFELRDGPDREGQLRKIIIFHLSGQGSPNAEQETSSTQKNIESLRDTAYAAASPGLTSAALAARMIYTRSRAVRDFVLARAAGICECCNQPAPFKRQDGSPYLEPHHTRRLSDDGLDHPRAKCTQSSEVQPIRKSGPQISRDPTGPKT